MDQAEEPVSRSTGRAMLSLPYAETESTPPVKTVDVCELTVAFMAVTVVMNCMTMSTSELEFSTGTSVGSKFRVTSGPVYLEVSRPPKRMVPLVASAGSNR
jgi:hypothetical protein